MSSKPTQQGTPAAQTGTTRKSWFPSILWGVAALMVALTVYMALQRVGLVSAASLGGESAATNTPTQAVAVPEKPAAEVTLPELNMVGEVHAVARTTNAHTDIPDRPRSTPSEYTVEKGDSLFGIAKAYDLKPASVLWANTDVLHDNVNELSIGQSLKIPPTDGILYEWKNGDKLDKVAEKYHAEVKDILTWPGNKLDLLDPVVKPGALVMIPDGWRPTQPWLVPTLWRSGAGANRNIAGGCASTGNAVGGGYFVWPAGNHYLSGNDFWDGHLGIDIAAGEGAPVFASDTGVVVYAAPIGGGYGNMIMVDHGNGFTTLYAHLSVISVGCGQNVIQGQRIGLAGSTGNSTGPHLHFEVRQNGAFINPWFVLP